MLNIFSALVENAPLDQIRGVPGSGYQAEGLVDPAGTAEKILSNVIGFITIAAGLTFVIYLLLAGLTWITAREEAGRMDKAKQMITNALIGLLIVATAWAVTGIMETVFGYDILNPKELLEQIMPGSKPPEEEPPCVPGKPC